MYKLVKVADVRLNMDKFERGEISYTRAVELINEAANREIQLISSQMKNKTNTTLEIPEGSKATIQGKVIDGKNYLVVEVEQEQEPELKQGDMAIFWDYTSSAIIAVYRGFLDGRYLDHLDMYWYNAIKWDGTKEQYEKVLRGELKKIHK